MTQKTKFKDALDYIFIANDSGSSSYLISSATATATTSGDLAAGSRVTSAISVTASAATSGAVTAAAATAAAVSIMGVESGVAEAADVSAGSMLAENLYGSVAVGLGGLLINDTLLMDVLNDTNYGILGYSDITNVSDLIANSTVNVTATDDDLAELLQMAATSVVLGLMILVTIIGNVFVIAAIILERNLQNVANYLVASLAVADLFVACLVMPLGAVYEISQGWILGPELCDIWTSCDVLCCTASILHLVAIAVDRYWAVTNIDYIHSRTSRRVFLMIFCVWSAAVIVSLAPQFGWKDPDYLQRIEQQKCMVSQDVAYQVFATCCTFYVPLMVILVLYWKIYQTARKRIHRRRPRPIDVTGNNNQPDLSAQKKRNRLRLRIGKFSGEKRKTATTLGLVEGNSTNTVNTVEDTEFSSSNVDSKSRAGIEVTTAFSTTEEAPLASAASTSHITTVSHLVALANQQHAAAASTTAPATTNKTTLKSQPPPPPPPAESAAPTASTVDRNTRTATAKSATHSNRVSIVTPNEMNGNNFPATAAATGNANGRSSGVGSVEVLEDPLLQQQLAQVQQQHADAVATTATPTTFVTSTSSTAAAASTKPSIVAGGSGGGATSASNATTITSISALSPQTPNAGSTPTSMATPTAMVAATTTTIHQLQCSGSANASGQATPLPKPKQAQQLSSIANPMHKVTKRKETLEAKRERKAAKTLAIITGAFVVCWLPFFVMALMLPLCAACQINDGVAALFLWLGYFNSTLNPVIYTIFSPEFRQAFKRILFGGHRPVHYRSGKL